MAQKKETIDNDFLQTSYLIAIFKAQARIIANLEKQDEKEIIRELHDLQSRAYQALISPVKSAGKTHN